jgi:superfamily II DNA/RNA helicase
MYPAEVQRRAATVVSSGLDAIIMSETGMGLLRSHHGTTWGPVCYRCGACMLYVPTGSGKTLAFLVPMLSRLTYPPDVYLDDMKGPQVSRE